MAPQNEYDGSTIRDEREDDLFTAIGKRVESLQINDTVNVKRSGEDVSENEDDRAEAKVMDKIESLCMNCEENVSSAHAIQQYQDYSHESGVSTYLDNLGYRAKLGFY